ncbi:NusB antitermination factor [Thermosyntropha lipolytica DSM 11003]|uniref:Transcription antitermination protein NusB n=1 Tax=Thermosyntropha lipolytica DSM 11003 TaxID=1123382 RepID=A0A1M5LIY8_9FIRM|nr:transcription antitermination factor NusB [Thermosyntropha lipolytica]SHG64988.1 NusB antitermination factor [Thermosyntropha lipolytica DSM 11003]
MSRRRARETAFKVVFQVEQSGIDPGEAFAYLLEEKDLPEKDRDFAWRLVQSCLEHREKIDQKIAQYSRAWDISRMSSVDRNIMRIAAAEMLYLKEDLPVIAIDEAIELAKVYGDEKSSAFVNAILDKIAGEIK